MPPLEHIAELVGWYIVFVISATFHEACHAWAALRGGDLTAFHGGQVSLDPTPHLRREPFGMLVLPIISLFLMGWPIGFASAPYDPAWASRYPRRSAYMALAGPAGNLFLFLVAALGIRLGMLTGHFYEPETVGIAQIGASVGPGIGRGIVRILSMLFSMNLILVILNMIPLPPLDGSDVITLLMKPEQIVRYRRFINMPGLGIIGLILAWRLFGPIFNVAFLAAVNCLYPGAGYS